MSKPTDETLIEYADGRLLGEAAAEVERYLEGDAEARRLVDALRRSGTLLGEAFAQPMQEPPPRKLVDMILNAPAAEVADNVVRMGRGTPPRPTGRYSASAMALAASLALAIGVGAGFLGGRRGADLQAGLYLAIGPVAQGSAVHTLLETLPTGQAVTLSAADRSRVLLIATFRDRAGRPCREVELLSAAASDLPVAAAVACRMPDRNWRIEGAAGIAAASAPGTPGYVPSGSRERDVLEGLLNLLGAGAALSADEEARLIGQRWRSGE